MFRIGYLYGWNVFLSPDVVAGAGAPAGAGDAGTDGDENGKGGGQPDDAGKAGAGDQDTDNQETDLNSELTRLRAKIAEQKAAIDKATKEAGDYKKALRAKQTAEEAAAEEKKAADEKRDQEVEELRREVARTKAVKAVMSKLGTDEETSGKVAEYLYGAEDIDAALAEIARAWTAREKALKLEYGKIPAPGAGGANGEDAETAAAIQFAKEMGKQKAQVSASVQSQLKGLIR